MAKKGRYVKTSAPDTAAASHNLPTDKPIAVYYRQSTTGQVGNVSTAMQKEDLPALAVRMGWSPENVILIDTDEGMSGAKRIDERPGMTRLFGLVTEEQISTILVQDESRLFRDQTMIQPNIFIDACKTHQITVIADGITYQFHDPATGSMHMRIFRFKAEAAADFLQSQVIKMQSARKRNLKAGKWVGGRVQLGYIIDPQMHFVVFEPIAQIIREWFRLFVEVYEGNLRATAIHIRDNGPQIPDLDSPEILDKVPNDHHLDRPTYRCGEKRRGFLSENGLKQVLANPMYIGTFYVNGVGYTSNNHAPIVPNELFTAAFNYISDTQLNGTLNSHYKPHRVNRNPIAETERGVARPFFEGLIHSFNLDNISIPVYASYTEDRHHYYYICVNLKAEHTVGRPVLWSREAALVDNLIVRMVRYKLLHTPIADILKDDSHTLEELTNRREQILKQRDIAHKKAKTAAKNSAITDDPDLFIVLQNEFKGFRDEATRLDIIAENLAEEMVLHQQSKSIVEEIGYYADQWYELTSQQRRKAARFAVVRVDATVDTTGELSLLIKWKDGTQDTVTIPASSTAWLNSDWLALLAMLESGASQLEIMSRLFKYTWKTIRQRYFDRTGERLPIKAGPARHKENIFEYWNRTKDESVNLQYILPQLWYITDDRLTAETQELNKDNIVETKFVSISMGDTTPKAFNVGSWTANQVTDSADDPSKK